MRTLVPMTSGKGVPKETKIKHFKKHWKHGITVGKRGTYIILLPNPKNVNYIDNEDFSDEALSLFKRIQYISNVVKTGNKILDGQDVYRAELQIYPGTKVWVTFDTDGTGILWFTEKFPF